MSLTPFQKSVETIKKMIEKRATNVKKNTKERGYHTRTFTYSIVPPKEPRTELIEEGVFWIKIKFPNKKKITYELRTNQDGTYSFADAPNLTKGKGFDEIVESSIKFANKKMDLDFISQMMRHKSKNIFFEPLGKSGSFRGFRLNIGPNYKINFALENDGCHYTDYIGTKHIFPGVEDLMHFCKNEAALLSKGLSANIAEAEKFLSDSPPGSYTIIKGKNYSKDSYRIIGKTADGKFKQFDVTLYAGYFKVVENPKPDPRKGQGFGLRSFHRVEEQLAMHLTPSAPLPKNLTEVRERIKAQGKKIIPNKKLFVFDFDETLVKSHWHYDMGRIQNLHAGLTFPDSLERLLSNAETSIRDKDALTKLFRTILNQGHDIAITSNSRYPDLIRDVLRELVRELGLSDEEIKNRVYYREPDLSQVAKEDPEGRLYSVLDAMVNSGIEDPASVSYADNDNNNIKAIKKSKEMERINAHHLKTKDVNDKSLEDVDDKGLKDVDDKSIGGDWPSILALCQEEAMETKVEIKEIKEVKETRDIPPTDQAFLTAKSMHDKKYEYDKKGEYDRDRTQIAENTSSDAPKRPRSPGTP